MESVSKKLVSHVVNDVCEDEIDDKERTVVFQEVVAPKRKPAVDVIQDQDPSSSSGQATLYRVDLGLPNRCVSPIMAYQVDSLILGNDMLTDGMDLPQINMCLRVIRRDALDRLASKFGQKFAPRIAKKLVDIEEELSSDAGMPENSYSFGLKMEVLLKHSIAFGHVMYSHCQHMNDVKFVLTVALRVTMGRLLNEDRRRKITAAVAAAAAASEGV